MGVEDMYYEHDNSRLIPTTKRETMHESFWLAIIFGFLFGIIFLIPLSIQIYRHNHRDDEYKARNKKWLITWGVLVAICVISLAIGIVGAIMTRSK